MPFDQTPHSSDLGPDLPPALFTSRERWDNERIHALAMYCSDGRWGEAFDEFCQRQLLIPRYDRWAVPGGPGWLAAGDEDRDFVQAAREQLDFLVRAHNLERLVLITHFGCAWYGARNKGTPVECLPAQLADVRTAAEKLRASYPNMQVEAYLAMRRETWLSFHPINTELGLK